LPSGVSTKPEIEVTPKESVQLTFYPKNRSDSRDPSAPLIYITQEVTDARPLSAEMSSEMTERKVGSRTVSFQSGLTAPDEVALAGLWRDGELLWTTDFIWRAGSPQQTAPDGEMEAEAIRVIESLITEGG
jgi:hypothetical protein